MKNSTVAHNWANRIGSSMKGSNFYFEGDTIYSYGSHFPIATIITVPGNSDDFTVITTQKHSISTSCHTSLVRNANWRKIIEAPIVPKEYYDNYAHSKNIEIFVRDIMNILNLATSSVKSITKVRHLREAEAVRSKYLAYIESFGLEAHDEVIANNHVYASFGFEEYQSIIEADNKVKSESKERAASAKKAKEQAELKEFYAYERNYIRTRIDRDYVRFAASTRTFQTSQEVWITFDHAKRFFTWMQAILAKGGCKGECKYNLAGYEVREISADKIVIGCHTIYLSDIDFMFYLLKD